VVKNKNFGVSIPPFSALGISLSHFSDLLLAGKKIGEIFSQFVAQ